MDGRRGPPRGALRAKGEGLGGFRVTDTTMPGHEDARGSATAIKSVALLIGFETQSVALTKTTVMCRRNNVMLSRDEDTWDY